MIEWRPALGAGSPAGGLPPFLPEPRSRARAVAEWPLLLVAAALIAILVRSTIAQAFYIPSGSMIPQLEINDRVVVSKLSYRFHEVNRGDIVVFDAPPEASVGREEEHRNLVVRGLRGLGEAVGVVQPSTDEYIKRVIGLPGETVEGRGGAVLVDGHVLSEPYLPPGTLTSDFPPTHVGRHQLWVMGDNRGNSSDSRFFGPIPRESVVGRAILRVWPPGRTAFL